MNYSLIGKYIAFRTEKLIIKFRFYSVIYNNTIYSTLNELTVSLEV